MQTFLPFPNITNSLDCLDKRRLGKQRVETRQILNILEGLATSLAWRNHPAVLMWQGYHDYLILYYNESLKEFEKRGGKNIKLKLEPQPKPEPQSPFWFGNTEFHRSHQSNLLRKAIADGNKTDLLDRLSRYGIMRETSRDDLPYIWPINKGLILNEAK